MLLAPPRSCHERPGSIPPDGPAFLCDPPGPFFPPAPNLPKPRSLVPLRMLLSRLSAAFDRSLFALPKSVDSRPRIKPR